jgi:acetate kinase
MWLWQTLPMQSVLTINGGSSSIRFAMYDAADTSRTLLAGKLDRIGLPGASLTVDDSADNDKKPTTHPVDAADQPRVADYLLDTLAAHPLFETISAVGHRIVYGMQHSRPERVTPALLAELKRIMPYDPEHLPREIALLETVGRRMPTVPQVACFDTAFHRTMPRVATIVPIPRRYEAKGVQRYGFHGLSYTYLMSELVRLGEAAATRGRVILAHLGSGASLAAVRDGCCIDTSMGFTPTSGLVMSTRSGDLDPGVVGFLAATESMDAAAYEKMVTHESGLLGVSETSADIRDLLAREASDVRAAEAVALFCYQVKKWIGSFAAAMGGIDALVFAGGIGENAPEIRARICAGLEFLGLEMDAASNARSAERISSAASRVSVRVIPTDEELVIADSTLELLGLKL